MPSVEEAAVEELYPPIATKTPFPYVDVYHGALAGMVRRVQVMPSVEEAAVVELDATATNIPFP